MRKYIIVIIFLMILAGVIAGGVLVLTNDLVSINSQSGASSSTSSESSSVTTQAEFDFNSPTQAPLNPKDSSIPTLKQTAWIPDWDFTNGFNSLKANYQYFDSVSPVWYYLNEDGSVKEAKKGVSDIRNFTKSKNIKLIPSISDFNSDNFHNILKSEEETDKHIDYLINEIETNDYDGFDLDYESIYINDQPEYLYLIKKLYEYLDARDKKLTIAVMPKWTDMDVNKVLRQTRKVQDWGEIGQYVHELRIMTYEVTGPSSKYPGPISPIDWMEANLRYAERKVDMDKVVLGIGLYAYGGWGENLVVPDPYLGVPANPGAEKVQASALTYDGIVERKASSTKDVLDPITKEKMLYYTKEGSDYIAFYMDDAAAAFRFDLAKKYAAAGVAHWRMGSEDASIYKLISD